MFKLTPKNLIIQILSVGGGCSISVEDFIGVSKLFGFNSNAVRVALARLSKDSLVLNDERGFYRLYPRHNCVDGWLTQWRRGIKRTCPWDDRWLSVCLPKSSSIQKHHANLKAISRLGFREGLPGLWVRPNNLRYSLTQLRDLFDSLGLSQNIEIFIAEHFSENLIHRFSTQLWPVCELKKSYRQLLAALKKSYRKCQHMSLEQALVETFILGGEVIWALARDPLLPESILSQNLFQQLTQAMLEYDRLGRQLWAKRLPQVSLVATPVQLSLVKSA